MMEPRFLTAHTDYIDAEFGPDAEWNSLLDDLSRSAGSGHAMFWTAAAVLALMAIAVGVCAAS